MKPLFVGALLLLSACVGAVRPPLLQQDRDLLANGTCTECLCDPPDGEVDRLESSTFELFALHYGRNYRDDDEREYRFRVFQCNKRRVEAYTEQTGSASHTLFSPYFDRTAEEFFRLQSQRYHEEILQRVRVAPSPRRIRSELAHPVSHDWSDRLPPLASVSLEHMLECPLSDWALALRDTLGFFGYRVEMECLLELGYGGCAGGNACIASLAMFLGAEFENKSCVAPQLSTLRWAGGQSFFDRSAELYQSGPWIVHFQVEPAMQFVPPNTLYLPFFCEESNRWQTGLVVGYSVLREGEGYWKIRTAWGADWGTKGHLYLPYGRCGVEKYWFQGV